MYLAQHISRLEDYLSTPSLFNNVSTALVMKDDLRALLQAFYSRSYVLRKLASFDTTGQASILVSEDYYCEHKEGKVEDPIKFMSGS